MDKIFNLEFIIKFIKFGIIGTVLFGFDATCFWLLIKLIGIAEVARVISVTLAMALSWWLNRRFTFHADQASMSWAEMFKFMASQLPGACLNALVSVLAFHYFVFAPHNPWVATAFGSCAGLIVNFCMANFLIFNKKRAAPVTTP